MPQNPTLLKEKEGDKPTYMWSVDAAEAMRLGDYAPLAPNEEVSPEERASAMSRFKTGQGVTHPELQTEEEKEETRRKANEEAELLAGLPPSTPIVVQAPSDRPSQREARQAASRQSEQQRQERERQEREQRERQEREQREPQAPQVPQSQASSPPPPPSPPPSAPPPSVPSPSQPSPPSTTRRSGG